MEKEIKTQCNCAAPNCATMHEQEIMAYTQQAKEWGFGEEDEEELDALRQVFDQWSHQSQEKRKEIHFFIYFLSQIPEDIFPILKDYIHSCGLFNKGQFLDAPFTEERGKAFTSWSFGQKIKMDYDGPVLSWKPISC